ncbi:recombinase family protein [Paeniglutamicibacter sp. Y32M11]|uniref:recombinase family protein n=1 Tax=Paeniglutamicibacter sp. Y32M11 TaxID=2853258 RepID=UPI00272BD379|nr:recombinase family protein [Paeniglutamicibacter sp. Y32M11]
MGLYNMALIGYMRVSTGGQNTDGQYDALMRVGVKDTERTLFSDEGVSGALAKRPQLDACLKELREGDTLIVAKLDRLGRSLGNLITLVNELNKRGVKFKALDNETIDTTTKDGRLMLNIFGALAEYERELIIERTKTGLDAAKARGRVGGRRPVAEDDPKVIKAKERHAEGKMTPQEIADSLKIGVSTLYRYIKI